MIGKIYCRNEQAYPYVVLIVGWNRKSMSYRMASHYTPKYHSDINLTIESFRQHFLEYTDIFV